MKVSSIGIAIILASVCVHADDSAGERMVGQLGYPVGTIITIEGSAHREVGLKVKTVNGRDLATPVTIRLANLAQAFNLSTGTVVRLKGRERPIIVWPKGPPATHTDFLITEVLHPDTLKIREERSPNDVPQVIVAPAPKPEH